MSARGRRLAAALILLAAALFTGRWLSSFLADRWWAATVSPQAAVALSRRALTGLGLDALGILVATAWFGLQARAIYRTIQELGPRERGGNPAFREALQGPAASYWIALAVLLLAVLTGSGLSEWTDALSLAGSGLRFGVADPALGIDAGIYVTRLPVWLRLQAFATALVLSSLGLVGALLLLSGALRVGRGRLAITDRARRHLGLLLGALALVIATSRWLAPYELAAGLPFPVAPGVVQLHRSASLILVGVSLAVAMLSFAWALRPVHGMAAGVWLALSAALVGAEALLPDDRPDPRDPSAAADLVRFEAIGYGLTTRSDTAGSDPPLSLWDGGVVADLVGGDGGAATSAVPAPLFTGDAAHPVWIALDARRSDSIPVVAVADDTTTAGGLPLTRQWGTAVLDSVPRPLAVLSSLSVRPGAPAIEVGTERGVALGGPARRLALAWALQSGRLIPADRALRTGWHLTPASRLRHIAPWALWAGARPWIEDGRLSWVVDGFITTDVFPVNRRRSWQGRPVSYARAGFVGIIEAGSGAVEIFLRPGADSLAVAWSRVSNDLVRPSRELPKALEPLLSYPEDLLLLQADLLAARGHPEPSPDQALRVGVLGHPLPGPTPGAFTVPLARREPSLIQALLIGDRVDGADGLRLIPVDSARALEGSEVLERRWQRLPLVQAIRDSVGAAGTRFRAGGVRYAPARGGQIAWQPMYAVEPNGLARLLAVAVAKGGRFGVGRTATEAWRNLAGAAGASTGLAGAAALLDEARRWAQQADSALRRGDLEAFGKAFRALQAVLEGGSPPEQRQ